MRAIGDAGIVTASHVAHALSLIGAQVLLARALTPAEFGSVLLVQSFTVMVEGLLLARNGEIALYVIGHAWHQAPGDVAGHAEALRREEVRWVVAGWVGLVLAAPFLGLYFDVPAGWYLILSLCIPLQSGYGVSKALFIAGHRVRAQAWLEIISSATLFVAVLVGILVLGTEGFLIGTVLAAAARAGAAARITSAYIPARAPSRGAVAARDRTLSTYSFARSICNHIANQADLLILGIFGSKESVALYKVARTLSALPGRFAGPVWAVLRPRLVSHLGKANHGALRADLGRTAFPVACVGVAALPLAALCSGAVLAGLYGEPFRRAAMPLVVLFIGNWALAAVTGWFGTVAVMSPNKAAPVAVYALMATLVVAGAVVSQGQLLATAVAVALAMTATAGGAWIWAGRAFSVGANHER